MVRFNDSKYESSDNDYFATITTEMKTNVEPSTVMKQFGNIIFATLIVS